MTTYDPLYEQHKEPVSKGELQKKLVLYDDNVNKFEYAVECLVKYCKHTPEHAEKLVELVERHNRYPVKEGSHQELEPVKEILSLMKLTVTIE